MVSLTSTISSPTVLAAMLSLPTPNSTTTLGRVEERLNVPGQMIDALTTTIAPLSLTTFSSQEEFTTGSTSNLEFGMEQVDKSTPILNSFHDILKYLGTSSDYTAFINALLASFSVILVSELGDKTFIITAIMAMKNSRLIVFISSAMALLMMTVLSVVMGVAVTVVPKFYTHYASIVLFLCFGIKMLHEAYSMACNDGEPESEFEELEKSMEEEEPDPNLDKKVVSVTVNNQDSLTTSSQQKKKGTLLKTLYVAPLMIKVFTMIFVAEWGDRSQIGTIILAAREDVVGVFIGSLSGHILCTGLAVIGGRFVAEIISIKTLTLIGGLIFLFFALFAVVMGPE